MHFLYLDNLQGNCKKSGQHETEPAEDKVAMSGVSFGDFSGGFDDVVADTKSLLALSGASDVDALARGIALLYVA